MAQKVIIHSTTRVIRRLTTDESPFVANNETSVIPDSPLDISNGPWKLHEDNRTLLHPTQEEIDISGVDEERNKILKQQKLDAYKQSINLMLQDLLVQESIKNVFKKLLILLD